MVSNFCLFYTGSRGLGFRYQIALNFLRGVFDMMERRNHKRFRRPFSQSSDLAFSENSCKNSNRGSGFLPYLSITWVKNPVSSHLKTLYFQWVEAYHSISHFQPLKKGQNGILQLGRKSCRFCISPRKLPRLETPLSGVIANLLIQSGFGQHWGVLTDTELETLPLAIPDSPLDAGQAPLICFTFHTAPPVCSSIFSPQHPPTLGRPPGSSPRLWNRMQIHRHLSRSD